jgi:hypothetical protein
VQRVILSFFWKTTDIGCGYAKAMQLRRLSLARSSQRSHLTLREFKNDVLISIPGKLLDRSKDLTAS